MITIVVIVAVMSFLVATVMYATSNAFVGAISHGVSIITTIVLLGTWFWSLNWNEWGPMPIFFGVVIIAAVVATPFLFREELSEIL
jgi:hypothetical protein